MRARVALGAALIWLGAAALASAQTGAQPVRRLLLLEPLAPAVAERIGGQTADLPWALERVPAGSRADPLGRAAEAARQRRADAVLWVVRDARGAFVLELYDPARRRLLERRFELESSAGTLAESAALEALALSVRSALRALAADEAVGEAVAGSASAPETTATPAAAKDSTASATEQTKAASDSARVTAREAESSAQDEDEDQASAVHAAGSSAGTALAFGAGWDVALDRQSPVQQGPWLRIGVALGRIELAAQVQTALAAELRDPQTRFTLQRRVALAVASLQVLRASRASVALDLAAGAASWARSTPMVTAGLVAKGATDELAFAFALALRAQLVLLTGSAATFGLELAAGAMTLSPAPAFRYQSSTGRVDRPLWPVQPQLHLGPYLRLQL